MAPKQNEDAANGLRVINFIVYCVFKSNFLDHRHVLVPFAPAVTKNIIVKCSTN